MKVWAANIVRVTAATALLATASVKAPADEGMWLVTQIASLGLPAKGLKIDPPKIFRSDGPCIGRAIVNLGGVTGLMPVTGLTLPFFSAGGSSLFVSMIAAGLLLSVARRAVRT